MDTLEQLLERFSPVEFDLLNFLKFLVIAGIGCSLLGVIIRLLLGKRSSLNESVSSAIGIVMLYLVSIALFTLGRPYDQLIAPLPFVRFAGEYLSVFMLKGAAFPELCTELLELVMLSFLVNLLDHLIPKGSRFLHWLLLRCLCIVLALAGQWALSWVFTTYLPEVLLVYAPVILLILLVLLLGVTVFKFIIGVVLGITVSPIIGAIYTFFISNLIGRQIVKAAVTTAILTGLVALLNHYGCALIALSLPALLLFLPALALLVLVWYILYKLF